MLCLFMHIIVFENRREGKRTTSGVPRIATKGRLAAATDPCPQANVVWLVRLGISSNSGRRQAPSSAGQFKVSVQDAFKEPPSDQPHTAVAH